MHRGQVLHDLLPIGWTIDLDTLQEIIEYFAAVSTVGTLALFTPLWAPRLIYSGISPSPRQVPGTESVRSFTLAELSCVFVYVGIANALFNAVRLEYQHFRTWSMAMPVLCNALAVAMWMLSLQFANQKGVAGGRLRLLTILFFFPSSAIAMSHAIVALLGLFALLNVQDDSILAYFASRGAFFGFSVLFALALRMAFRRVCSAEAKR